MTHLMILRILLIQHSKNWFHIGNFMRKQPYHIFWSPDLIKFE